MIKFILTHVFNLKLDVKAILQSVYIVVLICCIYIKLF